MVKLPSWTLRFVCGFGTWQNCRCCQQRPSKVPPVPGAGFPRGLPCAASCAHCRAQMWAQNQSWDLSSLSLGLWQQSQLCSEERLCSSWAAAGSCCWIQEGWVVWGSQGLLWFPLKPQWCSQQVLHSTKHQGWTMEGIPEVSNRSQHKFCFSVNFYIWNTTETKWKYVLEQRHCQILPGHEGVWIKTQ